MAENQLNRQLVAGIRAAQQGNRERARELLEGVLRRDRNNEQAWIWMASVVETQRERRMSLERVLKINPNNRPAQQALNSMVGVLSEDANINFEAISAAANTPIPGSGRSGNNTGRSSGARTSQAGGRNLFPILAILAVVLILLFLGITFLPPLLQPDPTEAPTQIAQVEVSEEVVATIDPAFTPPPPTIQPSPTFSGTLVTVTRDATLPPTFTPTTEPTATNTALPTATIPASDNYDFIILGVQGSATSAIYSLDGDTTALESILSDVSDIDFDPVTGLLVYTRQTTIEQATPTPTVAGGNNVSPTAEATSSSQSSGGFVVSLTGQTPDLLQSQMFITNINNLSDVVEITSSALPNAFSPSISPNGDSIAFVSDNDGDFDIYIYDIDTRLSTQITENDRFIDTDPDWSPEGDRLVFSSDRETPARNELFILDPFALDIEASVVRVTDSRGNNVQPQWSPVSNDIVYLNINGESMGIRLTNESGRSVRELTNRPDWVYSSPSWTPDGNYILFSSSPDRNQQLALRLFAPQTRTEQAINIPNVSVVQVLPR